MRTKLYLTVTFVSLVLFFFSMWQINPVVVREDDFLGLSSHLTVSYWLGLTLVTCCSVKAYLDKKLRHTATFIAILLALGLFLYGPRVFAEANPAPGAAYWVGAGYRDALSHQPLDLLSTRALDNYSAWPGFHFVTSGLLSMTGVDYETLAKYMPLFWLLCCAVITLATGLRMGLSNDKSFLLSLLTVASLWVLQNYYGPQMLAFIQYLLLFMLIATRPTALTTLLIALVYLASVVSHGLTSVAVLLAAVLLAIYARRVGSALLFLGVFLVWIAFLSPASLTRGVTAFREQVVNLDLLAFLSSSGYQSAPTVAGQIGKFSRFVYPVAYALLMSAVVITCVGRKIDKESRSKVVWCLVWTVGVLLLLPLGTGWKAEVDWRVYIFLVPTVALVVTIALSDRLRPVLAAVAVVFVALHVPANYHTEALQETLTSELRGAEYFAQHIDSNEPTYVTYGYSTHRYIQFYDPTKLVYQWRRVSIDDLSKDRVQAATALVMEECELIITTDRTHNALMYTYGFDPELEWIGTSTSNLIYTNGHYQVYRRK